MARPIRRKYRRGLPVLVHRRTGPPVRHRVLRWRPSISPRRCKVAAKARIWGPKIGSIRPSRLARLRTRALRCRERRCYRAMVPIPPNGPSPPPFPFALVVVDSSSPPSSTFYTLSFFLTVSPPVFYRHFQPPPSPRSLLHLLDFPPRTFLPSFLWSLFFCPPPSYHRNFHEVQKKQSTISESSCARRFLYGEHNLPHDLTFLWHFHHGQIIMIFFSR